jgi:hypothetical protein
MTGPRTLCNHVGGRYLPFEETCALLDRSPA